MPLPYADARDAANAKFRAGGYNVTLDPGDDDDTPLPGAAERAKATAIAAAVASTAPAGSVIDAPGAPTASQTQNGQALISELHNGGYPATAPQQQSSAPPMQPHQFNMKHYDDLDQLKAAATAGGIDVSKVPDSYWQTLSDRYKEAHNPGVIETARHWINATGAGHFMQGWDAAGPSDTIPLSEIEKVSPAMAEQRKADQFFTQNIQTRIVDKGRYVTSDGRGYNPPPEYNIGKIIGSMASQPGVNIAADPAGRAIMGGVSRLSTSFQNLVAANPRVASFVGDMAKWGLAAKIFSSAYHGGPPPPM